MKLSDAIGIERMAVARRLRDERLRGSIPQSEVAEAIGVGTPHVSRIENGWDRPSNTTLRGYAELFGYDPDEFLMELGRLPEGALEMIRALRRERDTLRLTLKIIAKPSPENDVCGDCKRIAAAGLEAADGNAVPDPQQQEHLLRRCIADQSAEERT